MALDLNSLAGKTAVTTVEFLGQSAVITYNPVTLTADNFAKSQKGDDSFTEFFAELVTDWDVKRGAKKVPLTVAGLRGVPLQFLRAVFAQIMSEKAGDSDEGKASSGS